MQLINMPDVKLAIVGVSRDCFPAELTRRRLAEVTRNYSELGGEAYSCPVIIENEMDTLRALENVSDADCNAAVVYLGNFGPEGPTTLFIERFPGPVMVVAAAEENKDVLRRDRGDALCGLLNCSYNLGLRRLRAHIPSTPVATPDRIAKMIAEFILIARVVIGLRNLKIFSFGPRPQDFYACNAPIQPLMDLGVEVMENSELDLLQLYQEAKSQKDRIRDVAADMKNELGDASPYDDLLLKLAQYEIALLDFMEANLGVAQFGVFANKCWPAFEKFFGFVPCFVNSRLAGKGIPVACEVDLYGAMSEYLAQLATEKPATLLDINNSVPTDIIPPDADLKGAKIEDLFMGFHCGNTHSRCMKNCGMTYHLIMNRLMEDGGEPDITRGTLEGQIRPGPMTLFRLQGDPDGNLLAYVANGEFLDIDPHTFGSTGIIAIPEFRRFYRHVLIENHFPHHAAIAFDTAGKTLFDALRMIRVFEIGTPKPAGVLYDGENPFDTF